MRSPTWLAVVVSLTGVPGAPTHGLIPVGLELREGAAPVIPPAAAPQPAVPAPALQAPTLQAPTPQAPTPQAAAPAPSADPVRDTVAQVIEQRARGDDIGALGALSYGTPPSKRDLAVLDQLARAAGLERGEIASVVDRPRDQARFLVERLFDPSFGEARLTAMYGLPGRLAAESYRQLRNRFQVLDLNATQKETIVSVVEAALVAGDAVGQVRDVVNDWLDVDPGPHADRARFEQAIAESPAITQCVRPSGPADRFYLLVLPRDGAPAGGAVCRAPWTGQGPAGAIASTAPRDAVADSGGSGAPAPRPAPPAPPRRIAPAE